MSRWWTPIWSHGTDARRLYCGIARTEEGFAVDVFRGDTCIESLVFETRADALKGAADFERQFARQPGTAPPAHAFDTDTLAIHG
jgi:hypothetical protein